MANLAVEISGLRLRNPVLTAAGPTSRDGMTLLNAAAGGAGGLVAKTVSIKPAEVPHPNMAAVGSGRTGTQRGVLNAELWSEIPLEQWIEREYPIALSAGLPLIASIGYTPEDVSEVGPKVEAAGVRAIEFSTHYVGGHEKIAQALRKSVKIPIFAKLSPRVDVRSVAKSLEPYVDGIVAINTYGPCLRIDIERGMPFLGSENGSGWLSGAALKPIAMRCVADIASVTKRPVIAVGGVMSGEDAIEFFMAGASAVQVCTAAILEGPTVYGRIAREIEEWLDAHGKDSVEDIRGAALKHMTSPEMQSSPEVDMERCTLCGLCVKSCVYNAIVVDKAEHTLSIDVEKCARCGLCVSACPYRALSVPE